MALRPTKDQIRGISELATTFRWSIEFSRKPKLWTPPINFNLLALSTEIPRREANQVIAVNIRGFHIDRPGIVDNSHQLTITLLETCDNEFTSAAREWSELSWSYNTGVQQNIQDIQGDLVLTRLDNLNRPIWQYVLLGVYLLDSDPGGELGSDAEALRPTFVLNYDDFKSLRVR